MRNETEIIEWVSSMSYADKLKVYLHYYNTMLKLNLEGVMWFSGYHDKGHRGTETQPTTVSLNVLARYHGRAASNNYIQSFDEFTSADHISTTDHGEDWQKNGWAQRIDTRISGIYNHLYKFQHQSNPLIPE